MPWILSSLFLYLGINSAKMKNPFWNIVLSYWSNEKTGKRAKVDEVRDSLNFTVSLEEKCFICSFILANKTKTKTEIKDKTLWHIVRMLEIEMSRAIQRIT